MWAATLPKQGSLSAEGCHEYQKQFLFPLLQGYCTNGQCRTFAIAVSGFGSPFKTSQDSGFESDFVSWVTNANVANDGLHNPVSSFFWNGWDNSSYGTYAQSQ